MDHGFLPAARDGSVARSTHPVWHAAAPGDYLPPTPAGGIPAVLLGFSDAVRSRTFYARAVRPAKTRHPHPLRVNGARASSPPTPYGRQRADEFIIRTENGGDPPLCPSPNPAGWCPGESGDEALTSAGGTATFEISGEVTDAIPNHPTPADIATVRVPSTARSISRRETMGTGKL